MSLSTVLGDVFLAALGDVLQVRVQFFLGVLFASHVLLDFVHRESTPVHSGSNVSDDFFEFDFNFCLLLFPNFIGKTFGRYGVPLEVDAPDGGRREEQINSVGLFALLPVVLEDGRSKMKMDTHLSADELVTLSVHLVLLYEDYAVRALQALDHRPVHGGCSVGIWRKRVAHRSRPLVFEDIVIPPLAPVQCSRTEVVDVLLFHEDVFDNVFHQLLLRD